MDKKENSLVQEPEVNDQKWESEKIVEMVPTSDKIS